MSVPSSQPEGVASRDPGQKRTALGYVGIVVLVVLLLGMWRARDLVMLCFAGVLLATILSWPAEVLARWARVPRAVGLVGVLLGLLLLAAGAGYLMGNSVAGQIETFQRTLPEAVRRLQEGIKHSPMGEWGAAQAVKVREYVPSSDVLQRVSGFVSSTFGVFGNIVVVTGVALLLALDPGLYVRGVVALVPIPGRPRARQVMERLGKTLRWWFLAQLLSMTMVGLLTGVGLGVVGVPLAATLGVVAALLNVIPNFGPLLAAVPGVLIALAPQGTEVALQPGRALYAVLVYLGVQAFDGWLFSPFVQQRAVALPPALIIVSQVLLLLLIGPLGLLLATPMLAVVLVLVKMLYIEDTLGDHTGNAAIGKR